MPRTRPQFQRLSNGQLPDKSWPGLYPLVYQTVENETLCATCANRLDPEDVTDQFVLWETTVDCDQCGRTIEPAY